MPRKRLTQIFPFLLPIRKWQRKKLFYLKMRLDRNRYSKEQTETLLPEIIFQTSSPTLNEKSGFDMKYQYNKVHNLRLAAKTVDRLIIRPGETFSFWQAVRFADKTEKYKDGLNLVNGKIVGSYGGGLCQLSSLLFWMILNSPLTVTERHGHAVEAIPPAEDSLPLGTDATVNEGWLDLKAKNSTENTYQLVIKVSDRELYGELRSDAPLKKEYFVYNSRSEYLKEGGKTYQIADVWRNETDVMTGNVQTVYLYENKCEISYEIKSEV